MSSRVPVRLLVHFQIARRPLVQVTEGVQDGAHISGAGTRAINVDDAHAELPLFNPATGAPLNETISIGRALVILYSLTKVNNP